MSNRQTIYITMDGGLIQSIESSRPMGDIDVIVIDLDTEGSTPEERGAILCGDGTEEAAHVSIYGLEEDVATYRLRLVQGDILEPPTAPMPAYEKAKALGYNVAWENGGAASAGAFEAVDPDGNTLAWQACEADAWKACDNHRMFGDVRGAQ